MKRPRPQDFEYASDYESAMEEYEQELIDRNEEKKLERKRNERE